MMMMMIEEHETVWANDAPKATRHSHDLILLGSSRQTGIVIFSADGVGFVDTTPRWRIVPWYSVNGDGGRNRKERCGILCISNLLVFTFKFKTKMMQPKNKDPSSNQIILSSPAGLFLLERILLLLDFHQPPLVE